MHDLTYLNLSILLSSIGIIFISLNYLFGRKLFLDDGLLSKDFVSMYHSGCMRKCIQKFGYSIWNIFQISKLAICFCVITSLYYDNTTSISIFFPIVTVLLILERFRIPIGDTGAEQQTVIVCFSLSCILLFGQLVDKAASLFIISQLLLCYFTSGLGKLKSVKWRNGAALIDIMSTKSYGRIGIYNFLRGNPGFSRYACWVAIIMLMTFPLVLFVPQPFNYLWMAFGLIFHLSNAIIMGLTTFLFAFLSAYPILIDYLNSYIRIIN